MDDKVKLDKDVVENLIGMTKTESKKKSNEIKDLSERHRMVMRLDLMGKTNKEIASITNYSQQHISNLKNSENYQETKRAMRAEMDEMFLERATKDVVKDPVKEMLENAKVDAMRINIELMKEAEKETVKQRSVFDILDRAGYKPKDVKKHEGSMIDLGQTVEDDIREALNDLKGMTKETSDE